MFFYASLRLLRTYNKNDIVRYEEADDMDQRLLFDLLDKRAKEWSKKEKKVDKKEVKKEDKLFEYLKSRL